MTPTLPTPINDAPLKERIRNLRNRLGVPEEDLAARLGVSLATLRRWEVGSSLPSPQCASKLEAMGIGAILPSETSITTVPRIKNLPGKQGTKSAVARFREEGTTLLETPNGQIKVLPAPFVCNGPPDQAAFHHRMLQLQAESQLPVDNLSRRLSMVEEVEHFGQTSQHLLERPRTAAVSWNSNYGSHGWHRYVGRFPAHVIRGLLNYFGADSTSLVCDPFVGSGTTAVECRLLGIPFIGIEICPLSAMITRTKSAFPSNPQLLPNVIDEFIPFYKEKWNAFVGTRNATNIPHDAVLQREGNNIPHFPNVERWFTTEALLGSSIAVEFGMEQEGFTREAVLVALSAKMRSIGNVDVDVVRAEYRKTPRENVDVAKLLTNQLKKMAQGISASLATHSELIGSESDITVQEGSVLDIELGERSISHIITSPPYGIEAISYLRTHLLSYRSLVSYLGHNPYDTRDKTVGSEYLVEAGTDAGARAIASSQTCRAFFSKNQDADDPRRTAMMQFCDDMLTVGEKIARWLKPGGQLAFVIGNKRLGTEVIPMESIVTELFASSGLQTVDTIRHKLKTNNSNSQVPWQERTIQEEYIILFRKPRT